MNPFIDDFSSIVNMPPWLLGIILTWTLIWKGLALWKAAKRNSSIWFVLLLVINTIGILEILYFYLFSEMKLDEISSEKKKKRSRKPIKRQKALLN